MKKFCSESVSVMYNPRRKEFYARVEAERGEIVADYYAMNAEDIAVMSAAYPDLIPYLTDDNASERNIAEVNKAVAEYNAARGVKKSVVWLMCDFRASKTFVQINDRATSSDLEAKRETFTDIGYTGKYDYEEMTAFAKNYRASSEYVVVYCDKCEKHRAVKINGDRAVCDCGAVYKRTDAVYRSSQRAAALGRAAELNRPNKSVSYNDESGITPKQFWYKGVVYMFNEGDCALLHSALYADHASNEVFAGGEHVTGFTQKYESYLAGLNRNGVRPELYKERNRTITDIRNRLLNCDDAQYYYFNKYGMSGGVMRRMRRGEKYEYGSPFEYAEAVVSAQPQNRAEIVSLFDGDSCNFFFKGYEPMGIELSRLIHDATGRFVYIREDGGYTDFGKDFIRGLAARDGLEDTRGMFLQEIRSDEKYWTDVKGDYTDECEFITPCSDNYGWLCLMLYAMTGRKVLKYGRLEISDSERGERTVRAVVENAYRTRSERALAEYADLTGIFELGLADRLEALCAVKTSSGERVTEGLKPLLLGAPKIPSVDAYLFCSRITLSDRSGIAVMYGDKCDTVFSHARRAAEDPGSGGEAVKKLISDKDVTAALGFIFDDIDERRKTLKARFLKLVAEADKLCAAK